MAVQGTKEFLRWFNQLDANEREAFFRRWIDPRVKAGAEKYGGGGGGGGMEQHGNEYHNPDMALASDYSAHAAAAAPHSGHEVTSNKSTSTSLGTSNTLYPSQNAVKSYVDTAVSGVGGGGGGGVLYDTQANRPAAADNDGVLFMPTDGYYPSISNGSTWDVYAVPGFKATNPPAYNTLTKVGSASGDTLVADGDGLLLTSMGHNSGSVDQGTCFVVSAPAAPYTLTVGLEVTVLYPASWSTVGLTLVDGTSNPKRANLSVGYGSSAPLYINIAKWSSLTSWSANYVETVMGLPFSSGVFFLRIQDDNTNRNYLYSKDGRNWQTVYSVGRTDFLTPTHVGLEVRQYAGSVPTSKIRSQAKIFHWSLG